jgi:hypothetical protein
MKSLNLKVLTVLGGVLLATTTIHANLVIDGTFDDATWLGLQPTDSVNPTASPWSRSPDQGVIVAGGIGLGNTEAAAFAPLLSGTGPSLLTQTLTTIPGQTYSISFWLSGGNSPANATFSLLWDGSSVFTLGPPVATPAGDFQHFVETAVATGTSTVLGFQASPSGDPGTYQPRLDNIDVESVVPEPTTVIASALLLLPFGASTLRILRRNRMA